MSMTFDHTLNYYNELNLKATDEKHEDGQTIRVFRGSVVKVYRSLSIPQSYYSKVRKSLIDMGCITILQQGARGQDSVVVLHHPPTLDEFKIFNRETVGLTQRLDNAILARRVDDLTKLVGGVNVVEALYELDQELRRVKREVEKLGKKPPASARRVG